MKLASAILAAAFLLAAAPAQAQFYSKCRTVQGTVIIASGTTCPAGTIWIGSA